MLNLIKHTLISVFLILSVSFAFAHEESESTNGIIIHEAVAAPAKRGEHSKLRLKITNYSMRNLSLKNIRADVSNTAKVEMRLNGKLEEPRHGIAILREETLDLASSHINVELVGLTKSLIVGDKIGLVLDFGEFETQAIADVH